MKFKTFPVDTYTRINSGLHYIYADYFWAVTPNDEFLKYRGAWQCNPNRSVLEALMKHYPKGTEIQHIPYIYIPANASDYVQ